MAYIRKRGSNWSYTIDAGTDPVTGKRKQSSRSGFRTKKDAELAASKAELELADGTFIKEQNMPYRKITEKWMEYYKAGVISVKPKPGSVRQREYQIAVLLRYFDNINIKSITRSQYQEALIDMSSELAFETRKGIHSTGRMIFKYAMREEIIKKDPSEFAIVPKPKENIINQLPKYFEKEELAKFLELTKHRGLLNDYPFYLTLAYTGMRIGEACVLKWADVDFKNQSISIKGTLDNPTDLSGHYNIVPPKTKTSYRTIDIDETLTKELERLKAIQNEFKMMYRNVYHDGDFVFGRMDRSNRNGKRGHFFGYPPKRRTMEKRMDRLMEMMGANVSLTPHSLRHTHASLLAEAGVSLEAIQDRLGHRDDATTKLIYMHVTKTVKRQAADKFGALMSDVSKMWSN